MRWPKMRRFIPKGHYQMVNPQKDSIVMSEGLIIHGKKDGEWKYYDEGVISCVQNFSKGKFNGLTTYYNQNGEIECVYEYEMDELISTTCSED